MTRQGRHSTIAGLAVAVLSVAAVTVATYGLREFAPPISVDLTRYAIRRGLVEP